MKTGFPEIVLRLDPPATTVRRVVTGVSPDGKSRVASDTVVAPITVSALPGYAWHRLWSLDRPPAAPNDGAPAAAPDHFPPPHGVRFSLFTVPPAGERPAELSAEAARELEDKLPGRARHMDGGDQAGLHASASIDFIYVVAGEIWLELDDAREVHLQAGDTVVQNGVRHAWRNRSDQPCTLVVCLLGVERR